MQYTLILTEKTEGGIQVTIPVLPACRVEAATRDEAIRLAREAIAQLVSRSEIVQVDIPQQPRATAPPRGIPWEWFGEAKADSTWEALFDDLSSAVRPHGMWNSTRVSVGRQYPPRLWAGPCDIALVSPARAMVRDCPPLGRRRSAPRTVRLCAEGHPGRGTPRAPTVAGHAADALAVPGRHVRCSLCGRDGTPPPAAAPAEALCRPDDCCYSRRWPACLGHPQSG